jgi:hypothetical protein
MCHPDASNLAVHAAASVARVACDAYCEQVGPRDIEPL